MVVSGYDSNSIGTLFSSLSKRSNSISSSTGLESVVSDYYSIRNGSYGKLLKTYYSKDSSSDKTSSTKKVDVADLSRQKTAAKDLKDAADALLDTSSKSVFEKTKIKGEDGTETTGYDVNKIYNAVKEYADAYNEMVDTGAKSSMTGVLTATAGIVTSTTSNKSLMSQLGISINSKNKMSIDEETFKKANMDLAKAVFSGNGSYMYQVSAKASTINNYVSSGLSTYKSYSSQGVYTFETSAFNNYSSYT